MQLLQPVLIPDTRSPLAEIYLPNWKRGQAAALDVMVISTLQQSSVAGAATVQGYALTVWVWRGR